LKLRDEKARNILKVGKELFAKFGMHKTTMDDIARKAGIAKGTIYLYYRNKEEFFMTVFKDELDKIRVEVETAVNAVDDAEGKFRAYVFTRMRCIHKLATLYEPFMEDYLENYAFLESIRQDYNNYEVELIKSILNLGLTREKFEIKNIDFAAFSIVMALKGVEYYWGREKDEKLLADRIDSMLDMIFNGLNKRQQQPAQAL
jgi:AcrR family transcriptional regulator